MTTLETTGEDERPIAVRCEALTKSYDTAHGTELAVNDVSLTIRQGEIVGIVGRNGCGKSTLLKMLAGVVKPTSGKAEVHGRVLAVLEVGTGFIPELSGEDNVRLTCRMAGMKEEEANALLPGIAAFSELGSYMAEPVKNYSQGMYLRLAISAMFALKADVYLFDEVVSVGDEGFQSRCMIQFVELSKSGATIVIVLHNVTQILRVCNRVIELRNGSVNAAGLPNLVCQNYRRFLVESENLVHYEGTVRYLIPDLVHICYFGVSTKAIGRPSVFLTNEYIQIEIHWERKNKSLGYAFHLNFYSDVGGLFLSTCNVFGMTNSELESHKMTQSTFQTEQLEIPPFFLNEGRYTVELNCIAYTDSEENMLIADTIDPIYFYLEESPQSVSEHRYYSTTNSAIRTLMKWESMATKPYNEP
jgi:ABC-type polysaccharide/polyol phosphate transport system ATPase subunit